jgi:hypothetical protein
MAEPFPTIPTWIVWLTIVLVILLGAICLSAVIAGIYMAKWWLWSLGTVFCALYYFKVLRRIFR